MDITAHNLKARHREVRDGYPEALTVRIHRALSWVERADREMEDADARFVFLWIAFNAAYASEFGFEQTERAQARAFVDQLVALDGERKLHGVLFGQFSGPVRTLVDNKFVFDPFWRAMREHDSSDRWKQQLEEDRKLTMRAVMDGGTAQLLATVLDRLYVLRNQIVHGGATWNSQANRSQVRDAGAILGKLLPVMIALMMDNPAAPFGDIAYPVVPA